MEVSQDIACPIFEKVLAGATNSPTRAVGGSWGLNRKNIDPLVCRRADRVQNFLSAWKKGHGSEARRESALGESD